MRRPERPALSADVVNGRRVRLRLADAQTVDTLQYLAQRAAMHGAQYDLGEFGSGADRARVALRDVLEESGLLGWQARGDANWSAIADQFASPERRVIEAMRAPEAGPSGWVRVHQDLNSGAVPDLRLTPVDRDTWRVALGRDLEKRLGQRPNWFVEVRADQPGALPADATPAPGDRLEDGYRHVHRAGDAVRVVRLSMGQRHTILVDPHADPERISAQSL